MKALSPVMKIWLYAFGGVQTLAFMIGFGGRESFWHPGPMLVVCGLFVAAALIGQACILGEKL